MLNAKNLGTYANLYTPALRDNRGHGMVQVVGPNDPNNPNNMATVTWFSQDDLLKGRPYETLTLLRDFFDDFPAGGSRNRYMPEMPPDFRLPIDGRVRHRSLLHARRRRATCVSAAVNASHCER